MTDEGLEVQKHPDEWMLKDCEWYKDEYNDCTCLRGRFNQYFVYGKQLDCSQWKTDQNNCKLWKSKDDQEAFKALLASEKQRRLNRLTPHYNNDTWTRRSSPPPDWSKPLPEEMQKKYQNTYLDCKQKGLETGNISDFDMKLGLCTIL